MDKVYAKIVFDKAQIPQADYAYVKAEKGKYTYVHKNFDEETLDKPKPFTGQQRIALDGWNTYDNFKLVIEQDEPLPFHITAVVLELNINDR
mgnify:CR=1 FL=1